MWSRKALKEQGQRRFVKNYWKGVLAGLVLIIALGRTGDFTEKYDVNDNSAVMEFFNIDGDSDDFNFEEFKSIEDFSKLDEDTAKVVESAVYKIAPFAGLIALCGILASAIAIVIKVFLLNPLEVGGRNFFVKNLDEDAQVGELGAGFSNDYIFTVKTMFLRDLYLFLWFLLLIVPGIIKMYEYRMIPYLLAENPKLTSDEAFAMSKKMMDGNKWDAFVLDLSFIGWHILSAITIGIVGVFYVNPYQFSTNAALYKTLSGSNNNDNEAEEYANYVEVE